MSNITFLPSLVLKISFIILLTSFITDPVGFVATSLLGIVGLLLFSFARFLVDAANQEKARLETKHRQHSQQQQSQRTSFAPSGCNNKASFAASRTEAERSVGQQRWV
ncbi:unnamed protein product [Protopolystoma xenopodis]|uniref:Uncharacterized protein n=1 Tax=Protopolystoma xenopodis TaxID=117903 RepID=A0A448XL81_9PLAT|nr:unnamed protein product [Protopolystoma xenopodis]